MQIQRFWPQHSLLSLQQKQGSASKPCSHPGLLWRKKAIAQGAKKGDVLITADEISLTHDGEKKLFEDLSFSVNAGDKLAVIGPNGSGKSSLLKLLYGLDKNDSGTLVRHKGANIGYLPQEPHLPEGATVLEAVLQSDNAVTKAVQQYQNALQASAAKGGRANKELEAAIEKMNAYNAWEVDAEAKRVLEAVGIKEELMGVSVDTLSGGQRKRVALAATLVGRPDLIIMDEPTNHMDVEMIGWMERELRRNELAVVLVTHDRYFMENVCDRMLELDRGRCFVHNFGGPGSYEQFKQARAFRRMAQANAATDAKTLEKREKEWVRKQPQGRQAKSQARVRRYYELVDRSRDTPEADTKVDFAAAGMVRQGNKVVNMENVGLELDGKQIIKNFTYTFIPGERMGIVGPNGAGKSTLLNLIADKLQPTTGKREIGETAVIGYFTQYTPPVPDDMRVISYIREIADTRNARKAGLEEEVQSPEVLLEKLGFPRSRQYQRVGDLSGGERRRLHLASVLIARPNVLILDEPTNDLDLSTVEVGVSSHTSLGRALQSMHTNHRAP
ncbi:P-loop containing nucleoside triphosphate hydrolase protein [Dunaliella salina]|uniref:P-loop containing nucleoside triphosphate hydrolase protein n=1 Tax=Dunaliella salina TaxID=3046 RepID=A0ABQ7G494_DUNSA|nr:P-loop containing nucleoside triphosphate hydrolase protein [Dunaliella salina]|eukprot:KAF5829440.1 P-loop containing nucleoside triphosphate hydrolase protein [Dunaliella salina]